MSEFEKKLQIQKSLEKLREQGIDCYIEGETVVCKVEEIKIPVEDFNIEKVKRKLAEKGKDKNIVFHHWEEVEV